MTSLHHRPLQIASSLILLAALGLAASGPARAEVVISPTVGDGNFDTTPALASGAIDRLPSGTPWSFTGTSGITDHGSAFGGPAAPSGATQYAFLQETPATGGLMSVNDTITQSVNLNAGSVYDFSFNAAGRATTGYETVGSNSNVYFDGITNDDFEVLNSNSTVIYTDPFATTTASAFNLVSGSFTPSSTGAYTVEFINNTSGIDATTALISNVNLSSAAPEPSQVATLAALGLGLGGLFLRARRRARACSCL